MEPPRLHVERKEAKFEQSGHEPNIRTNPTIPSYPRRRVSRVFRDPFLDSCLRRNDDEEGIKTQVDLKTTCFQNPSPLKRGKSLHIEHTFRSLLSVSAGIRLRIKALKGGNAMKKLGTWFLMGVFLLVSILATHALYADEAKITVLNPVGYSPPIRRVPMAPRLDALTGKTIYIVDVKFPLTDPFLKEMQKVLNDKYSQTNWVLRDKRGTYFDDDPALWAEIKQKGSGAIMGIGH